MRHRLRAKWRPARESIRLKFSRRSSTCGGLRATSVVRTLPESSHGVIPFMFLAYLDPGTGSLMIQAILAGALAVPFFFRSHIGAAVRWIRSRGHAADPDGDGA